MDCIHDMGDQTKKKKKKNEHEQKIRVKVRPSRSNDVTDEIRQSIIVRKSKKLKDRKQLITRVIERRESEKSVGSSRRRTYEKSRKKSPPNLAMQESIHQIMKKSSCSTTSFNRGKPQRISFSDRNPDHYKSTIDYDKLAGSQIQDDIGFACLTEENKTLRAKLVTRDARISLLDQQVHDQKIETATYEKQLRTLQSKAKRLSKLQNKERVKFDNATNLIAEARVGLTKALNEGNKLQTRIHDLELMADKRDRRLNNLYETIERQSTTIEEMNNNLRNKETVIHLNIKEKRKLEDEIAVLMSKDDMDTKNILRRLERERESWFLEREKQLENDRMELDEKCENILEQENIKYKQEREIMVQEAKRKKDIEINDQMMQRLINQQLDDMKKANCILQEKLTHERKELTTEIVEQNSTIIDLERKVRNLHILLAKQDQSTKELELRDAEINSVKSDLRDVERLNKVLKEKVRESSTKKSLDQFLCKKREKSRKKSKRKTATKNKTPKNICTNKERGTKGKTKKKKNTKKIKKVSGIDDSSSMLAIIKGKKKKKKKKKIPSDSTSMIVFKHHHQRTKERSILSFNSIEQSRSRRIPTSIFCTTEQ